MDNLIRNLPNSGISGESEGSSSEYDEEGEEGEESEESEEDNIQVDGVPWYRYDGEANAEKGICLQEQPPELISEV